MFSTPLESSSSSSSSRPFLRVFLYSLIPKRVTFFDFRATMAMHTEMIAADSDALFLKTISGDENEATPVQIWTMRKRKRSKRNSSREFFDRDMTEEEHLAMCLVMLARDGSVEQHEFCRSSSPISVTTTMTTDQFGQSYKCSVCDKSFGSYQAMGGHKASHRKPLLPVAASTPPESRPNSNRRLHRCLICFKTFPSGQALGGHKRCHYDGTIGSASGSGSASPAPAATATTITTEGTSFIDRRLHIDLNLPAIPEFPVDRRYCKAAAAATSEEVQSPLSKKPRLMIPA